MTNKNNDKPQYEDTYYLIPRYIRKLPGITLAFLDVYESMFQFWNKGLTCFLSNRAISERTNIGERQIREALLFFENAGELKRERKGLKRFLVKPESRIETDVGAAAPCSTNINQGGAAAPRGRRCSAAEVGAAAPPLSIYEYKEVEYKEVCVKGKKITQTHLNFLCLNDSKCLDIFESKFKTLDVTIEEILEDCVWYYILLEKPKMVTLYKFRKWLNNESPGNYTKKEKNNNIKIFQDLSEEEKLLIADYNHRIKNPDLTKHWKPLSDRQIENAEKIINSLKSFRSIKHI